MEAAAAALLAERADAPPGAALGPGAELEREQRRLELAARHGAGRSPPPSLHSRRGTLTDAERNPRAITPTRRRPGRVPPREWTGAGPGGAGGAGAD